MDNHSLGGFAIWSLDLDDYKGSCDGMKFSVLSLLANSMTEQRAAMKRLALDSGKAKLVRITLAKPVLEYERGGTLNIVREQKELEALNSNSKHELLKEPKFAQDMHIEPLQLDSTPVPTVVHLYPDPIQEPPKEDIDVHTKLESQSGEEIDSDRIKVYINLDEDQENNLTEGSPHEIVYPQKELGNYAEVLWNAVSTMMDSVTVIVTNEMRSLIPDNIITVLSNNKDAPNREKRSTKLRNYSKF